MTGFVGDGGVAQLFAARRLSDDAPEAIKAMPTGVKGIALERFELEASIGSELSHPDIVRVFDAGHVDGRAFLVMELLEGCDLSHTIQDRGFGFEDRLRVIARVARAISYAHERGILHRDVKPSNIFLTKNGGVRLLDFGVSKVEGHKLTATGSLNGTPAYMAPEVITGHPGDTRADIFALGVTLYELLTAELPWCGDNSHATLMSICIRPPKPFREAFDAADLFDVTANVARELEALIGRSIAQEPRHRFPTMSALADEVEALIARMLVPAFEVSQDLPPMPDEWLDRKFEWAKARAARLQAEETADVDPHTSQKPTTLDLGDDGTNLWTVLMVFFVVGLAATIIMRVAT